MPRPSHLFKYSDIQVGTKFSSSSVLGMLRMESGRFTEFVGARVSKVKVNSNIEEERLWLMGNCNPADLGTRSSASPRDLALGSEYQEGREWMKQPMGLWPCKKSFGPAPEEEMRKDMMEGSCNTAVGVDHKDSAKDGGLEFPNPSKRGLDRPIRVYGYVFTATYKRRKKEGAHSLVLINPIGAGRCRGGYPSIECL
jgi:hypothetical protein